MSRNTRSVLLVLVTLVWAANFCAPLFVRSYEPPSEVHIVFMGLIGVLLTGGRTPPSNPSSNGRVVIPKKRSLKKRT